jgi:hypothetical protein
MDLNDLHCASREKKLALEDVENLSGALHGRN